MPGSVAAITKAPRLDVDAPLGNGIGHSGKLARAVSCLNNERLESLHGVKPLPGSIRRRLLPSLFRTAAADRSDRLRRDFDACVAIPVDRSRCPSGTDYCPPPKPRCPTVRELSVASDTPADPATTARPGWRGRAATASASTRPLMCDRRFPAYPMLHCFQPTARGKSHGRHV